MSANKSVNPPFRRTVLPALLLVLLSVCLIANLSAGPAHAEDLAPLDAAAKRSILGSLKKTLDRRAFAYGTDFDRWPAILAKHQASIDAAEGHRAFARAVNEALKTFDVSHLGLMTPVDLALRKSGHRAGLGFNGVMDDEEYLVTYIDQDSEAWTAGLRRGDVVQTIDGDPMTRRAAAGEVGVERHLMWTRNGETFEATIAYRAYAEGLPEEIRWLDPEVALLRVPSFRGASYQPDAVERLMDQASGAKAIVIDMRGNLGGRLSNVRHLLNMFLGHRKQVLKVLNKKHWRRHEARRSNRDFLQTRGEPVQPRGGQRRRYTGKVIVLVDYLCGSGGEVFPQAIQTTGRGVVLGAQTRGAVLLSRVYRAPHSYGVRIPFAELVGPKGERIEGVGLTPDIELGHRTTLDDDALFKLALEKARS